MTALPLTDRSGLPPIERARLAAEVGGLATLAELIRWSPAVIRRIVVQDEYTHDVIVPWRDRTLVFDCT
jgi:hypothetical protein